MLSDVGVISAAPAAWTTRKTTNASVSFAAAQSAEATVNTRDAEQEPVLAREAIGQAPEDDEQGRVDDRVGVQNPREIAQPGRAEVLRDVRQRDVDDEHIQNCEGEADRDDQQDKRRRGVATASEELA